MGYGADNLCRNCGHRNRSGSRYCSECGSRIDGVCASCGHENEPQARFCNSCGAALGGEASPALPQSAASAPASAASVCPRCLHQNEPDSSFCYHCGLPLEGEAARAAPPPSGAFHQGLPGGGWMRVIALFIDNVVIVSLVVLIWGLFYALGIDNPDSGDDPSGVTTLVILIIYFLYSPRPHRHMEHNHWQTRSGPVRREEQRRSMRLLAGAWPPARPDSLGYSLRHRLPHGRLPRGQTRPPRPHRGYGRRPPLLGMSALGILLIALAPGLFWLWFFCQARPHPAFLPQMDRAHLPLRDGFNHPRRYC